MLDSGGRRTSIVLRSLLSLAKASIIVISVLMVLVTLSQVLFRYVFEAPLPWSEELARYCFVWIVFLGGAIGLDRGIHLGVDLFVNLLPHKVRTAIDIVSTLLIACFAGAVVYASFPVIEMNTMQRSPAMGLQMSWIYVAIPTGMSLMMLICLERIVSVVRNRGERGD